MTVHERVAEVLYAVDALLLDPEVVDNDEAEAAVFEAHKAMQAALRATNNGSPTDAG